MSVSASFDVDSVSRARVLVVEDEGIIALDLESRLRALGHIVCGTVATGPEAVEGARTLRPDIVLMDIRLSGSMDGIEAARQIRRIRDIPIVFLTAHSDPGSLSGAAAIGPFAYLIKPFTDRELQVTLIVAMCKHRAFTELERQLEERTEQLARTESRYHQVELVSELGLMALATPNTGAVIERAVELVADTLEVDLVKLLELQSDRHTLVLRAGVGWDPGVIGSPVIEVEDPSEGVYSIAEPVVISDLRGETRFEPPRFLLNHGVISGISVVIHAAGPDGMPYGSLGAHSRTWRHFSESDVSFLQAVGNVVATAIMRAASDAKVIQAERLAETERVRAEFAERAVQARDAFSSVTSHELRTPVSALQLQLDVMRELLETQNGTLSSRLPEVIARASGTVARLADLVEGILDVSRMALGSLELQPERFDLAELVREVGARHQAAAQRAGSELVVDAGDPVWGEWDRSRIDQVVTRLLSNAFKFGAGRPVELALERRGERARLSVTDHGEGIDPADLERILGRFERAASHRHYGGLGLGLYLAGQIVNEHGGALEVESQPGHGARFTAVLPVENGAAEG